MGHPSYKFYDDWNVYKQRCLKEDPTGCKLVFPEAENEIVNLDEYLKEIKEIEVRQEKESNEETNVNEDISEKEEEEREKESEKEEEEYLKMDPVRKFQYDYNKTTCMTNKFPETDSNSTLSFAPAEGKIPTSILRDDDWDINSFPNLHPSGQNKMFQEREVKLTPQQYLGQRLKKQGLKI